MYDIDTNNENGEIEEEFIDIQRNIWREQRRIYEAFKTAQKFGVDYYSIKKEMKERNISRGDIRRILNGDFDPLNFSEPRFKGKIEDLEKSEKEGGFNKKRRLNRDSFYPKYELKDILRNLKFQRLDEEFFYDKIKAPTIPVNNQTSLVMPNQGAGGGGGGAGANIQTPPLPQTPQPTVQMANNMQQKDPITNLTRTETALLSPTEKVIAGRT